MSESVRKEIIKKLSTIAELPTLPEVVTRLQGEMDSSSASAATIAEIVHEDPAITLKVLKVANSPIYGIGKKINDVRDAVLILGLKEVYSIVMSMSTLNIFKGATHINYKKFWYHCLSVAFATKVIVEFTGSECQHITNDKLADLFIAGLLHDIGILVLDQYMSELYGKVLSAVSELNDKPLYALEYEMLGISHGEVGEFLLNKWYIPEHISTAVAFHHKANNIAEEKELTQILHIADFICNNQGIDSGTGVPPTSFCDEAWKNLNLSIKDVESIITKVRQEADHSAIFMALA